MPTSPTLLVTGASSRTGSAILRQLSAQGHRARGLTRQRHRVRALEGLPGLELVEGDMRRADTLGRALDGVDRVLMISSVQEELVETQGAFVAAARAAGVPHIVKVSGEEAVIGFDPVAFRGTRAHEQAERVLIDSGVGWTMLRPSQFMQVYLLEAPIVARDGALAIPAGDSENAPIDIEDIARIATAVLTSDGHAGQRYRMTGPEALTMHEVALAIGEAIGRTVRYVDVAPAAYRERFARAGLPAGLIDTFDEIFAERRKRSRAFVDVSAHQRFGVTPTRFVEFARRHAEAFGA